MSEIKLGIINENFSILHVANTNEKIIDINAKGEVWINPKYTVAESAQIFWREVERINPIKRANPWHKIESESDLPTDGRVYWVTYKDFYKQTLLGKGKRNGQTWHVGVGLQIAVSYIVAVMPEVIPEPFEEK